MNTNKERRELEEKWQAEKDLKKSKEIETVVISLFVAFICLVLSAFTRNDFFTIGLIIALMVAIFTGR